MPTKQAKKPSGPVRYLLSADRRLRKLSLKRLPSSAAGARKPARSTRSKRVPPPAMVASFNTRTRLFAIVLLFLTIGAGLIAARKPADPGAAAVQPAAPVRANVVPMPEPLHVQPVAPVGTSMKRASSAPAAAETTAPSRSVVRDAVATTAAVKREEPKPEVALAAAKPPAAAVKPAQDDPSGRTRFEVDTTPPVTIVGCLERDEDTFWLKNTQGGPGIPTTRSWKSGFLRKRPASIALVDGTQLRSLQDYVGQRVAVTGTVNERAMRMRSLERVTASCN